MDRFSGNLIKLRSARKWSPVDGQHRVIPPKETYKRILPLMPLIEVTRIANLTGLDYLSIPVFAAVRPCADSPDVDFHYGKGFTEMDACVSAMMEAVERYSAEHLNCKPVIGTYQQVCMKYNALDPHLMYLYSEKPFSDHADLEWVPATDLLSEEEILIPANFAYSPFLGRGAEFWIQSTNGLASGNVMEEAVSHALAELIERDALTLAVVKAFPPKMSMTRALKQRISKIFGKKNEPFVDVELESLPRPLDILVGRIQEAGFRLWLKDITSDVGIASFAAALLKPKEPLAPVVGFGANPNAKIAAARAITEAVLNRMVQLLTEARRFDVPKKPRLWWADTSCVKDFDDVPSYENDDILDDINLMMSRLKDCGVSHIIAVNLTQRSLDVPVVRVIVPELECWCLTNFDPEEPRLGPRARRLLA